MKVFLGGTCNGSKWREELIPRLGQGVDYFNPVVEEWTEEARQSELVARQNCDILLYVITPEMEGFYSIAEAIDDSNKRPDKTLVCILPEYGDKAFTLHQLKSVNAILEMVFRNHAYASNSLADAAIAINMRHEMNQ